MNIRFPLLPVVTAALTAITSLAGAPDCDRCRLSLKPLDVSRPPTHRELIQSGQLGGALSPTGPEEAASEADRLLFGRAMSAWNRHDYTTALPLFKRHIAAFSQSPWRAEAELHLGCEARFAGRYAEAERWFKGIVTAHANTPGDEGEIVFKAKLRLGMLAVLKGDFDAAEDAWRELIAKDPDRRRRDYARNWLRRTNLYRFEAASVRRCGLEALSRFFAIKGRQDMVGILATIPADAGRGVGADELVEYARSGDVNLAGELSRDPAKLPVPWIAHYRFGHFVTVTACDEKGAVTLFDPILNHEVRLSAAQFAEEWSGLALVPRSGTTDQGMALAPDLLSGYTGGCCGIENANQDEGGNGPLCGGPCGGKGLCAWSFSPLSMNVLLWDSPLWYTPPVGPAIEFTMAYNAIDADNNLPSFGPKWVLNYHSYCVETPASGVGSVTVYMPDGRNDVYSPSGTNFTAPARVFNTLTKTGTNQYTLAFVDGTVWEYGRPTGATNLEQALLKTIRDRHSNAVTIVYDGQPDPRLMGVVDAVSRTSTLHYAESGLIDSITDPFGRSATMTYSNGYLATVTDMGGVQSVYAFNESAPAEGYVKSVRTLEGTVTFSYSFADDDKLGMWERERITATYEDGSTESLYYNGGEDGNPSTFFTDRNGHITRHKLAINTVFPYQGSIVYSVAPDASRVNFKYNAALQPTNVTDEAGQNWSFSYNSAGMLTRFSDPTGYQATFDYTNGNVDVSRITENTNVLLNLSYTASRDVASVSNALGQITRFGYDSYGRPTNAVDTLGVTNVYEYGADARLARVKRAGAVLAQFQFDAAGRTTNFVGPEGLTIAATFDNLDRLLTLTLPGESAYSLAYVTNDLRVSRATDRSGRRTDFSYSIVGALSSVRAPDLSLVRFEHDAEGNLLALLDSEIRKTRFAYDSRNRPIGKTYPDGTSNRVDWTVNSLVSNVTSPRGVASVYAYNFAGLLTNVTYSGTTNTPAIRLAYDSFNRPTNTVDGWSTNRFTYDILGRVTQAREIQGVFTQTFDYAFDQGGRLTNVAWKAGTNATLSTRYQYDNLNRITNLVSDAGSFAYTYASNGVLVKTLRYPNAETANYFFDGLRRMTNLLYKTSGGTANGQWSYTYDSRDFVTRRLDPATNTYAFRYDEAGRLVEATGAKNGTNVTGYPFRYAYDRAGNRTYQVEGSRQRRLTYNVNNQLLAAARSNEASVAGYVNEAGTGTVVEIKSDSMAAWQRVGLRYVIYTQAWFEAYGVTVTNAGTNTILVRATDKSGNASTQTIKVVNATTNLPFAYDLDGNRTNGLGTTLEWDAENRPVRFAYGTAGETRLRYDGLGRLREIAEYGTNAVPTNVVRYTWNGWLPWAELDASNRTQRTFTWGLDLSATVGGAGGIGGLMGMHGYTGSGTNYCVRTDGKGNITEVRQSNAVVVASYAYAPFGAVLTNTGSYVQPFRFQTKIAHARSGLGYWGYRWYDTRTGQWITRDPLAEAEGINLYAYCAANPLALYDSDGRFVGAIIAAVVFGATFAVVSMPEYAQAPETATTPIYHITATEMIETAVWGGASMGIFRGAGFALNRLGRAPCPGSAAKTPATPDRLLTMMNERQGVNARYATGDQAAYLKIQNAGGSHQLTENGSDIWLRQDLASRRTAFHEWMHRSLQRQTGRPTPGEDKFIESFLERHKILFRLEDGK